MHRYVNTDTRTAFSGPVALQYSSPEFAHPRFTGCGLEFFSPGEDVTERVKIIGVGFARVACEEGVGAEQYGAIKVVECGRHNAIMQGRQIEENEIPLNQRQDKANRQAEAVEQRQSVKETIRVHHVDDREHL